MRFRFFLTFIPIFVLLASLATAQDSGQQSSPVADTVAADEIESGLAEVAAASDLDETLSQSLTELYKQAKSYQASAASRTENAKSFQRMSKSAADDIVNLTKQLQSAAELEVEPVSELTPEQLRQELTSTQAEVETLSETIKADASEPATRQKRLAEIPNLVADAEKKLREVQDQLELPTPTTEEPIETRARLVRTKSFASALQAEISELKAEQAAYLATVDLLPLQKQRDERRLQLLKERLERVREASVAQQQESNDAAIASLRRAVSNATPELKPIAEENLRLAKERQALVAETAEATALMSRLKEKRTEVEASRIASEDRLDAVGLTQAMGQLLRSKRDEYQKLRLQFEESTSMGEQTAEYQVASFELEDRLAELNEWLASAASDDESSERALLSVQRDQIQETLQSQNSLLQTLLSMETENRQLQQAIDDYIAFADKNVFWIRSATPVSVSEVFEIPEATMWMLDVRNYQSLGTQFTSGILSLPIVSLIGAIAVLYLFARRRTFRQRINDTGKAAESWNAKFNSTTQSLVATVMLSLAWPALAAYLGGIVIAGSVDTFFTRGVGYALIYVALFTSSRHLLSQTCRDGGLADKHFGWSESLRKSLRINLRWYTTAGVLIVFVMILFHQHPDATVRSAISRFSATLLFFATSVFHHCIARPSSPVYSDVRLRDPGSKIYRFRRIIWAIAAGLPMFFAILTLLGYLDTAYRLGQSLQSTMLLFVALVVAVAFAFRWLQLQQAKMVREQALAMRRQKLASEENESGGSLAADVGIEIQKEAMEDVPALSEQTRKLVFVIAIGAGIAGLSLVWKDVLPAMELLDRFELYSIGTGDAIDRVTYRDILLAFIGIVATVIAVKNVPALLELLVLRRTGLDSGARYAMTTILRYVLTISGVILTLNFLSLPWTKLGWLLAAASVGLGFGLQEIFANFVSGIILLLERPVRVGDVVTIDSTTGVVSRIQMRATTVTSWDRKELVVPNKDLVTGKLLNWSLSNVINRLTINVGASYDSDVDQVREILQSVVADHPDVMDDPAPLINFEAFGDNSLNFVVRFFLSSLDRRVGVMHEVNAEILKRFRAAGISIPFPQREVRMITQSSTESATHENGASG
ncbi:mechanosensitive ion channel domain-containing protein [Neorhodopirellula pilleata]|uniref:Miniconductance mechanosensitive channel MscM n=1 Tax=Neorhodopirellula pilleata TaxID=2714738 RepID=A0A5C6ARK4_9BACT|nr:mechanosensitive ion channel domain-containing protein [Neorhodopirellula pilleata]TWU01706.1 Miniconductance mechanosensitive channel MscM precursor [Neorhodopirellula pilleata]